MPDNDTNPQGETVVDIPAPAVDPLADILDDPETDTVEDEVNADEPEGEPDPAKDDKPDGDDSEALAKEANPTDDGPELKGGRIAPKTAKVRLPDGQLIPVEEAVKGYLRQSDYTRKRQEDANTTRILEAERQRVSQTEQELAQQRQQLNAMLEAWKPQPPQNQNDYAAWIQYQQQEANWNAWRQQLSTEQQRQEAAAKTERERSVQESLSKENIALVQKFPAMADPVKRNLFFEEAVKFFSAEFGYTREQLGQLFNDHRNVLVARAILKAKRISAKAPEVKKQIEQKPQLLRGSKRSSADTAVTQRRAAADRLAETGSMSDAVIALKGLV